MLRGSGDLVSRFMSKVTIPLSVLITPPNWGPYIVSYGVPPSFMYGFRVQDSPCSPEPEIPKYHALIPIWLTIIPNP